MKSCIRCSPRTALDPSISSYFHPSSLTEGIFHQDQAPIATQAPLLQDLFRSRTPPEPRFTTHIGHRMTMKMSFQKLQNIEKQLENPLKNT